MNAANNLVLAPRGTTVVNHDNKAMNEQATKQDLHNQGIQIDSEFVKVDSQLVILRTDMNAGFDRVDGQFTNLRTDMDAKFFDIVELVSSQDSLHADKHTLHSSSLKNRSTTSMWIPLI